MEFGGTFFNFCYNPNCGSWVTLDYESFELQYDSGGNEGTYFEGRNDVKTLESPNGYFKRLLLFNETRNYLW